MRNFPTPSSRYPLVDIVGEPLKGTVFLRAVVDHPKFAVGDYTYASSFDPPDCWVSRLAPYLFDVSPEKLVIGKFCQIADGVQFITASANHRYDGISSYPFAIFNGDRTSDRPSMPKPGPDTIVGNDVWFGQSAIVMPGARIGDGVIVGAGSVVSGQIEPYTIVAGNPARVVRERFPRSVAERLSRLAWWNWPIDVIVDAEAAISGGDVDTLIQFAP